MLFQDRSSKVLVAALISIGIGAVVLKTLGNNPPPAGAFSLSDYYRLASVEEEISSNIDRACLQWNCIEISYSSTKPIGIDKQSLETGLINYDVFNYHFIVWNGLIGEDGQIKSTEKWKGQLSTASGRSWYNSEQKIRIGVIVDGEITYPTDSQIKKTEALVEVLSRRFSIPSASIYYPYNWWR